MADDVLDPADRIEALLITAEPRIQRAFMAAIQALRDELDLDRIVELLDAGDIEGALAYAQNVAKAIGQASAVTFLDAGQKTVDFLNTMDLGTIVFDQLNFRAIQAMQSNSLRLIQEFTAEQRRATHLALLDGVARGLNPIDQARNFRDSVGLTERQQGAVVRYRQLLEGDAAAKREALSRELRDRRFDRTVTNAATNDVPLTPEQVDRMVGRYQERYVKHRSQVIARTEALRSVHQGVEEGYQQAIDEGLINPDDLVREWDSSRDSRVRLTHQILNGQKKGWGQPWHTVHGTIRYPGDPAAPASETVQCRCLLTTRIRLPATVSKQREPLELMPEMIMRA